MFLEKVEEQLLEEIQNAMYEEHDEIVANWEGEFINLKEEDLEDFLRTEIFSDYLNIPLDMLGDLISQNYPFVKEKEIYFGPYSDVIIHENNSYKEIVLRVYTNDVFLNREKLSDTELRQLDKLCEEINQLYEITLDVDTNLTLTHIPLENVPEDYYDPDEDEDEYDFVEINF